MRQMILVWEQGDQQHTHQLQLHKPVLIGRHKACTICLPYATVSRRHALIFLSQDRVTLRNLSHINTIRSEDGQRVAPEGSVVLSNGQRFQVGSVTFRLLALPGEDTVVKIRCANCRRVVAYDPQGLCPWCGTALAAGQTVE